MFFKKEEKSVSVLKTVLIVVGAVVTVLAIAAIVYKFFKKHFKITFESGDCDFCDDGCFCEDSDFEPECCVYDGYSCDIADAVDADLADAE